MGIFRGGGENADLHFACVLRSIGCEVQFIAGRRWRAIDYPMDEFLVTYIRTPYLRGLNYQWSNSRFWFTRKLGSLATRVDLEMFEQAVLRMVVKGDIEQADVYQVCGLPRVGAWIHQRTRRPVVVHWPGPPPITWRKWAFECSATFAHGGALTEARQTIGPEVRDIRIGANRRAVSSR